MVFEVCRPLVAGLTGCVKSFSRVTKGSTWKLSSDFSEESGMGSKTRHQVFFGVLLSTTSLYVFWMISAGTDEIVFDSDTAFEATSFCPYLLLTVFSRGC